MSRFLRKLFRSLLARTLLPCAAVLVVTGAALIGVQAAHELRTAHDGLARKGALVTDAVARGVEDVLWNVDTGRAGPLLAALASDPDFASARIFDGDKLFAETGQTPQDGGLVSVSRDITHLDGADSKLLGRFELRYSTEQADAAVVERVRQMVAVGAAVVAVVIGLLALLLQRALRPIGMLASAMERLSEGRTDTVIPAAGESGSIGRMSHALSVFRDTALERQRLIAAQEVAKAQAEHERVRVFAAAADDFRRTAGAMIDGVADATKQAEERARSLVADTSYAETSVQGAAEATEITASNVSAIAVATNDLSATIDTVTRSVADSAGIARETAQTASEAAALVAELTGAAEQIGDIVRLIGVVAAQTNLLALNATIEAARAGEAGRGFAVVAQEVKALAQETTRASDDIGRKIEVIRGTTARTVDGIARIGRVAARSTETADAIAEAIIRQGETARQIAGGAMAASETTRRAAAAFVPVTESVGRIDRSAQAMAGESQALTRLCDDLRSEVGRFTERLRAA